MKTRLTFLLTAVLCIGLLFTSCHDDFAGGNGNNIPTGETTKTVSNKVQTMKLQNSGYYRNSYDGAATLIYQDFNHQCIFALVSGNLRMVCKELDGGYYDNRSGNVAEAGLKSVGKVNGIESITKSEVKEHEGIEWPNYNYYVFDQQVQPNYGYLAKFKTDNGDMYVRLFIKSYKFVGDMLSEITVEFQSF